MGIGLALGLGAAFGVSRVLATLLVDVTPTDPVTFASITGILAVVAVAACLIPARRATRVDPLVALRAD
jgi:ABC-type antimicrobial peptide transport system permease subunit